MGRDVFGRQIIHVPEQQGGSFARGEDGEASLQNQTALLAEEIGLGAGGLARMKALGQFIEIGEVDTSIAAEMIEGSVSGDAGEPMGGFLKIFQLVFAGESLDEGVLRKVLRVSNVPDDAVNEQEDPLEVELHELVVTFSSGARGGIETGFGLLHVSRSRA